MLKKLFSILLVILITNQSFGWGFYAHKKINRQAVFLLPPEMMYLYKANIDFITDHAVDPDMRRYALPEEGPRHYIDLDFYGDYPFNAIPHTWNEAVAKYTEDTLNAHGIVPWWTQTMLARLTNAFKEKNQAKILKLSAEIGHYIADSHVPLHTSSNHNGQFTNQRGIHGFWESRLPELFAEGNYDFFIGKAELVQRPLDFSWTRILESALAADSVLKLEAQLNTKFNETNKFSFEERNGKLLRQYSTAYSTAYNNLMNGMVERRMLQSIESVANYWFTAWVNAGQPDLKNLNNTTFSEADLKEWEEMNNNWKNGKIIGREEETP